MKKLISAVSAFAMVLSSFSFGAVNSTVSAEDDTLKIMCIGDSITDGYGIAGSYRKFLYNGLSEKGINVDMVGAKGGGWTPSYTDETTGETFEYDDENTGYSGYAIMEYNGRNGIYETLQSTDCLKTNPDIVILQIGTNDTIDNHDLDNAGQRLRTLIYYIIENIPDTSTLFVTTIPNLDPNRSDVYDWFGNYRHSADWQVQYTDEEVEVSVQENVDKYNSIVKAVVADIKGEIDSYDDIHPNLLSGDINSVVTDVKTQLADGVHPNNTGYKLMGEYWTDVVYNYLSSKPYNPVETTSTTTVTTETSATETTQTTAVSTFYFETETTEPVEDESIIRVSDLVVLTDWLNRYPMASITEQQAEKYDLNSDRRLDVFDLALMRKALISEGEKFRKKLETDEDIQRIFGEKGSMFDSGIVIYNEDTQIQTTTAVKKVVVTYITDLETKTTAIG